MERYLALEFSFDFKPVDPLQFNFFRKLEPSPPRKQFWVKLKGNIGEFVHVQDVCVDLIELGVLFVWLMALAVSRGSVGVADGIVCILMELGVLWAWLGVL